MALTTAQRSKLFGPPGQVDRVVYVTPWGIKVSIHPQILARFRAACEKAARDSKWRPQRIDSYNPRKIRGSSAWSLHAWAMAFDFFATPPDVPPPGGVWTPDDPPPPEFVECFTEVGFRWGGTFARVDEPHIEWADGLPAPLPSTPPPPVVPAPIKRRKRMYLFRLHDAPEVWATDGLIKRHVVDLPAFKDHFAPSLEGRDVVVLGRLGADDLKRARAFLAELETVG